MTIIGFYTRHIYANFKGKYLGLKLRGLFWATARATQVQQFNALIDASSPMPLVKKCI